MKKVKKYKINYIINKPRTTKEKERFEKNLAKAYDILFKSVLERKVKNLNKLILV